MQQQGLLTHRPDIRELLDGQDLSQCRTLPRLPRIRRTLNLQHNRLVQPIEHRPVRELAEETGIGAVDLAALLTEQHLKLEAAQKTAAASGLR